MKSPPELWAEVSDPDSLARHLGAFGEIRITRLEPEATVAWEGDRARGTVNLTASGWGTKVHLTAEPVEPAEPVDEAPEPEAEAPTEEPEAPEAEAPAPEPEAAAPEPEAAAPVEEPVVEEPVVEEPEAAPAKPPRRGFFARLFGRRPEAGVVEVPVAEEPSAKVAVEEEPPAAEVPAEPEDVPAPPVAEQPAPEEPAEEEPPAPVVPPAADAGDITVERVEPAEVLDGMLDTLGAAHHRPFSR